MNIFSLPSIEVADVSGEDGYAVVLVLGTFYDSVHERVISIDIVYHR